MTPEQEDLLDELHAAMATPERFSYDRLTRLAEDGFVEQELKLVPPASKHHGGHYTATISKAGQMILDLAAEREQLQRSPQTNTKGKP